MSADFFMRLSRDIQPFLKSKRAAGENFNLFQICGIARNEVYTHSALLCDLLNPKGSHDQGSVFLKLFLKTLNLDVAVDDNHVSVIPEYYLGPVTGDSGGKLDILIKIGSHKKIAIENKIDAAEQAKWVTRYRKHLREGDILLYLTLEGRLPKEMEPSQKEQVTCISYKHDILRWLGDCQAAVKAAPIVRESLSQYIHLLCHLTHQEKDHQMTDKIVEAATATPESFEAYLAIRKADEAVRKKIMRDLMGRINTIIPEGLTLADKSSVDGKKEDGFYFTAPALEKFKLHAVIGFDSANFQDGFQGFEVVDPLQPLSDEKTTLLKNHFIGKLDIKGDCPSSPKWPAWKRWPTPDGRWGDEVMEKIAFGRGSFDSEMREALKTLLAIANAFAE